MENSLIPQGIEIVSEAIKADNENEYERALQLYRDALERFTMALEYEKDETKKRKILERVEDYRTRAEDIRDYLNKQSELTKKEGEGGVIPQAIEIVSEAIKADNENEYKRALQLYRDALERFTMGLEYEKDEEKRKKILERVEGYRRRAEDLRDYLNKKSELDSKGCGSGSASATKKEGEGGVIPQGIEIVSEAIKADNENEYERALQLYRDALSKFTMALEYEKDEERRRKILERVAGYRRRAEEIHDYLNEQSKWSARLEKTTERLKETATTKFPQSFTGKRQPHDTTTGNFSNVNKIVKVESPSFGSHYNCQNHYVSISPSFGGSNCQNHYVNYTADEYDCP